MIFIKGQFLALFYKAPRENSMDLNKKILNANLSSVTNNSNNFMANLKNQIAKNWLTKITNIKDYFIYDLLKLASKSNSK